jgi:hypothetical protein
METVHCIYKIISLLVLQQFRGFQVLLTALGVLVGQGILMFQGLQAVPINTEKNVNTQYDI